MAGHGHRHSALRLPRVSGVRSFQPLMRVIPPEHPHYVAEFAAEVLDSVILEDDSLPLRVSLPTTPGGRNLPSLGAEARAAHVAAYAMIDGPAPTSSSATTGTVRRSFSLSCKAGPTPSFAGRGY
eukprot:scaffold180805_cov16-Prasinocladus_malaysianus.AAC.2